MKKTRGQRLVILLLLVTSLCVRNCVEASNGKHFSEALFEATFIIEGHKGGLATGFFIACSSRNWVALVTARHVLDSINGDSVWIYYRKQLTNDRYQLIKHSVAIRDSGQTFYAVHPDKSIDVAALRIGPNDIPSDSSFQNQFRPFDRSLLATNDDIEKYWIHPGDKLFYLGYPLGKMSPTGAFSILRSGYVASYPITPLSRNPYIYLDGPVFEGNSGGPVYFEYLASSWNTRALNQKGKIMGVISRYKFAETVRKIDPDTIPRRHDIQVGVFVNSYFVLELLDSLGCH